MKAKWAYLWSKTISFGLEALGKSQLALWSQHIWMYWPFPSNHLFTIEHWHPVKFVIVMGKFCVRNIIQRHPIQQYPVSQFHAKYLLKIRNRRERVAVAVEQGILPKKLQECRKNSQETWPLSFHTHTHTHKKVQIEFVTYVY